MPDVPTTLAIVEGHPAVGQALTLLLEGAGYKIRSLAYPFDGHPQELLEGVQLLLLPPTFSSEDRAKLLGDIEAIPALAKLPIVALMADSDGAAAPRSARLANYVPWPVRIAVLVEHIEAALP